MRLDGGGVEDLTVTEIGEPLFEGNISIVEALGGTPSRSNPDDYDPRWLAQFSSRGSASLPIRKPDLVANGANWIWSANAFGPDNVCSLSQGSVVGYQGTSMATPAADPVRDDVARVSCGTSPGGSWNVTDHV